MKVTEHLKKSMSPPMSFEILPPLRGENINHLLGVVKELADYKPPYIDVTSHASNMVKDNNSKRKKRPGTMGLCGIIQHSLHIDTVPHILCNGFTKEETEDLLIELQYLGFENVLALRGDPVNYDFKPGQGRKINRYASDLIDQIQSMNAGIYLDGADKNKSDFEIGVAGYPEGHFESPDIDTDIHYLKQKVDRGASYIVTQMFFDNKDYFSFVDKCRDVGITVPIIPGLKILSSKKQLTALPNYFNLQLPDQLRDQMLLASSPDEVVSVGCKWSAKQAEELLVKNVPSIHFYVMNKVDHIHKTIRYLKGD